MKGFLCLSTLLAAASAAPQLIHGGLVRAAGQTSHQSVSKPFQGEHRATVQSKAFGSSVAAVSDHPNVLHGRRGVIAHAAPLIHAAPAYHAPLVAHGPAEVYANEVSPYTYNYAVADDYSNSNFNAAESSDGTGNAEGSYSVALPDGRIQHVNYHSDPINGYIADVTYDGTAAYPEAVPVRAVAAPAYHAPVVAAPAYHAPVVAAPAYHAPLVAAPAYHAPLVHAATPVYRGAGQVSHQSVSKPYQGEHRATTQSKAFGSSVAAVSDHPNIAHGRRKLIAHAPVLAHGGLAVVG